MHKAKPRANIHTYIIDVYANKDGLWALKCVAIVHFVRLMLWLIDIWIGNFDLIEYMEEEISN